jgi:elongation factor 1-beta
MEAAVRGIEKDGLVWGASKFVVVGFGIKKVRFHFLTPLTQSGPASP